MPIATDVRNAITTEVAKVAGIGATGSDWRHWANEGRLPAAYTILDTVEKEISPTRSKTVLAHYRIAAILKSQNPEDDFDLLMADIETEIEDDPSLGNLVEVAWVTGCDEFATAKQISGEVYVRNIFVDVRYKHVRGAP